jgi:putative membrane protein
MSEPLSPAQPSGGVLVPDTRLHPVYLVIETAKTLRSAIPFLVVTVLGGAPWWVNAVLFGLVMVIATAQWHVKKYSVVGGVLRLRSGLVNRIVRVVPVTRITALDAYRSLTQRLIGVWGLKVQSPGDGNTAVITLGSLSGSRLDELRAALETHHRTTVFREPTPDRGPATIRRYLAWRGSAASSVPRHGPEVIAVLTPTEMLIAAITNNTIPLLFAGALVVWYRFAEYVPPRAADFMNETVEPRGVVAVLVALVVVAVLGGVVIAALRLSQFTLIRDGDVLRNSRGLLGKQSATIPVRRIQAVRIVEGLTRRPLGYCTLQVEVAGIGPANTDQRMLFPLLRTHRAQALIARALPELPWPTEPLLPVAARAHKTYKTLPLSYGAGFAVLFLLLPGWWRLLALLPVPLGYWLAITRARLARWRIGEHTVVLRWWRLLSLQTVIAHRGGTQLTEWSSSPFKARAHVAGFKMRFSSGRNAKIRYMGDTDAGLLQQVVGRPYRG